MPSETESNDTPVESPKKTKAAPKAATSNTYTVERLVTDGSALLGHPSYVVAGALEGQTGKIGVGQAKQAVEKFLNTEIKEG